jgi:hypothetical protein
MSDVTVESMTPQFIDNVIPFRRPAPVATDPSQERLQIALAALEAALEEQRVAIAAWRTAVGELHDSMQDLGTSMQTYRDSLDGLALDVAELNQVAIRMLDS